MQKFTSSAGLKQAIMMLEAEQAINSQLLKEHFEVTYESFKPENFVKTIMKHFAAKPLEGDGVISNVVGAAAGYLTKELVVGSSDNKYRMVLGDMLQTGVTSMIAKNPDFLSTIAAFVMNLFSQKKTEPE